MTCIVVKTKLEEKEKIIEVIQIYLSFKKDDFADTTLEKFLRGNFSKFEFMKFAKDQISLFGLNGCGVGEWLDGYQDYHEKACELYNKWFLN